MPSKKNGFLNLFNSHRNHSQVRSSLAIRRALTYARPTAHTTLLLWVAESRCPAQPNSPINISNSTLTQPPQTTFFTCQADRRYSSRWLAASPQITLFPSLSESQIPLLLSHSPQNPLSQPYPTLQYPIPTQTPYVPYRTFSIRTPKCLFVPLDNTTGS